VAADALERQRLVAEMTWLARFDPLTSLVNRTVFVDRLEHALHRVRRGNDLLAVLYCDLDGFKRVNDRLGHAAGDAVLREAATRLNATLRSADTAARFGGDEFAILAEDLHDEREATLLADRVVAALAAPFTVSGSRIDLGVSVGVATTRGDADAEPLLRDADMAMYRAKSLGRGRVELFDPKMRADNDYRVRLEDALRGSLDDGTLSLAYQPVVDLGSGRVDGFEALLRWTHPSLGAVPPDVLLPVAEASGLMPRLGRWVIAEAHRAGVALADAAGRPITMAVNMAAEQLRDEEFLTLAAGLASDPRVNLVLELTERALVEEAAAGDAMRRLAAAGAKLAIDDFGIGYSSISYLHQFDCIDIVKIDRSFVLSVDDPRTAALVRSIIAMADAFGTAVVAEGVEDLRNCAALAAAGCALAQGFLFSPAVPADAAAELVQDRSGFAPLLAESHRHQRTTPASRH
jgi:diguanylate cyclase (GGDEF)-like protein